MSYLLKVALNAFESRLMSGKLHINSSIAGAFNEATSKYSQPTLLNEVASNLGVRGNALRKTFKGIGSSADFGAKLKGLRTSVAAKYEHMDDSALDTVSKAHGTNNMRHGTDYPGSIELGDGQEGVTRLQYLPKERLFGALKTHDKTNFLGGGATRSHAIMDKHEFLQGARHAGGGDESGFTRSLGYELNSNTGIHKSMTQVVSGSRASDYTNSLKNAESGVDNTLNQMGYKGRVRVKGDSTDAGTNVNYYSGKHVIQDMTNNNSSITRSGKQVYYDPIVVRGNKALSPASGLPLEDYHDAYQQLKSRSK